MLHASRKGAEKMDIRGSSNWQGFCICDFETISDAAKRIMVRSEKYADAWKIRPSMALTAGMTPIQQASLETAIEIEEMSKWHATEHKLINLLMSGKPLTIENLKIETMIAPDCGIRNKYLKEPEDEKLKEAIKVGLEFLRKRKALTLKN